MRNSVLRRIHWRLVLGLAGLAMIRPLSSIVGLSDALGTPLTPVLLTVGITVIWVLIVGLGNVREPILTLVFAGLAYGLGTVVLSGVLSPILHGELQGPLARPWAIVPLLAVNALWGLVAGTLAYSLARLCQAEAPEHDARR